MSLNIKESDTTPPTLSSNDLPKVRLTTWGIFDVAHDIPDPINYGKLFDPYAWISTLASVKAFCVTVIRFCLELLEISPRHAVEYCMYTLWMTIYPALSLYLIYRILLSVDLPTVYRMGLQTAEFKNTQMFALLWLSCDLLTQYVETMLLYDSRAMIGPHLRKRFLHKFIEASLKLQDPEVRPETRSRLPIARDYGEFIPGWMPFTEFFDRMRHLLALTFETLVTIYMIFQQENYWSSYVLSALFLAFVAVIFLSSNPANTMSRDGYNFWTTNKKYKRLEALFNIIFDHQYEDTMFKDGQAQYFYQEYKTIADSLGIVKADIHTLQNRADMKWERDIARSWAQNNSMALMALALPWILSASPSLLLIIVHNSIQRMKDIIFSLAHTQSFSAIAIGFKVFYDVVDKPSDASKRNGNSETIATRPNVAGAKISLMDVSIATEEDAFKHSEHVNLEIAPGQFVVITGPNEGGKTQLAELISGSTSLTSGIMTIDDQPSSKDTIDSLKNRTVNIGKHEAIYPLSLEENIVMASPRTGNVCKDRLSEAIDLAGARDIVDSLGLKKVIEPCIFPSYSTGKSCGRASLDFMKRYSPDPIATGVTQGNRQRIIASRGFHRLLTSDMDLIVLNEATDAMNSIDESRIIDNFRQISKKKGQTMVAVQTHNVARIAKKADLIVYVDKGKIIQKGTHEQLMGVAGPYRALCVPVESEDCDNAAPTAVEGGGTKLEIKSAI